eukprot:Anaeramoba_ignava/a217456_118.p1 GENE.a217456_118~~a217456_118.p1  ORF type:complete len:356 (-),score=95.56 a217456_118:178-1245(-)
MGQICFKKKKPYVSAITLNDFNIQSLIGQGQSANVFQVEQKNNGQLFAMKVMEKNWITKNKQVVNVKNERDVLAQSKNPFLVKLHHCFQSNSHVFLIMDLVQGGELYHHLNREEEVFTEQRVKFYAAELICALESLHKEGIAYRDLKPENILIGSDGHIRLTDFGLVKMNISKKKDGKTSTFCGTPEYLAPEILKDEGYGKAVDWWSLGILIYEMLVGLPPFYSENLNVMYQKILTAPLKFPPGLSLSVRGLISELLNRDPAKRLGSGGDDSSPIKKHKFFEKLDWEKVFNKEMTPTFKPEVKNPTDTRFFDREFTEENLAESVPEISFMGRDSNAFKGFTFEEEVEGIGNVKNF